MSVLNNTRQYQNSPGPATQVTKLIKSRLAAPQQSTTETETEEEEEKEK